MFRTKFWTLISRIQFCCFFLDAYKIRQNQTSIQQWNPLPEKKTHRIRQPLSSSYPNIENNLDSTSRLTIKQRAPSQSAQSKLGACKAMCTWAKQVVIENPKAHLNPNPNSLFPERKQSVAHSRVVDKELPTAKWMAQKNQLISASSEWKPKETNQDLRTEPFCDKKSVKRMR
jgi:hypothetical protein